MGFDLLEATETPAEAKAPAGSAGALLRVGIPTPGGKILEAARRAGYSVLFSANAFMVRNTDGEVVSVRKPDPKQFSGLDAALDSAGFVAMSRYRGYPWTIEQYLDLVESWPWAWYASWDQCVEPEIASSKIDVMFRLAETCRLLSEVRMQARDRGLPDPTPILQGWKSITTAGHWITCRWPAGPSCWGSGLCVGVKCMVRTASWRSSRRWPESCPRGWACTCSV